MRHAEEPIRQEIEGKDLAAEQGFQRHRQNDQALNFQKPKTHEPKTISDAELNHRRHEQRGQPEREAPPVGREGQVIFQQGVGHDDGNKNQQAGDQSGRGINTKTVGEVIDGFQQELIDEAVADFLTDLVVLVEGPNHELYDDQGDEVSERLPKIKAPDFTITSVRRAPEDEYDDEMKEGKKTPHREIHAVH